jgi:hypothetical protein
MHRITYEQLDDKGAVINKQVWNVIEGGAVHINESRPVRPLYETGSDIPEDFYSGPHELQLTATIDPNVRVVHIERKHG